MIAAMLAETFLRVVEKARADLDVESLRADVRAFSAKHPDLTTREKAERLIATTARRAAALGAAASLPRAGSLSRRSRPSSRPFSSSRAGSSSRSTSCTADP